MVNWQNCFVVYNQKVSLLPFYINISLLSNKHLVVYLHDNVMSFHIYLHESSVIYYHHCLDIKFNFLLSIYPNINIISGREKRNIKNNKEEKEELDRTCLLYTSIPYSVFPFNSFHSSPHPHFQSFNPFVDNNAKIIIFVFHYNYLITKKSDYLWYSRINKWI